MALESVPPSVRPFRAPAAVLALRLAIHLGLFATAFALSWRPWHAALVTVVTAGLFGAGSRMKHGILGEPLVFSDAALVRHAIRHPKLYYAEKLARPPALLTLAGLALATALWFAAEPSILPDRGWPLWLALPPMVAAATAWALTRPWV
ncbi:LTA synthase family protein, partial [Methylopila musalis]